MCKDEEIGFFKDQDNLKKRTKENYSKWDYDIRN